MATGGAGLRFPWTEPPPEGSAIEVAEGVLWIRMPLPLALDHVNIYALADNDGGTIIDTGVQQQTRSRDLGRAAARALGWLAGAAGLDHPPSSRSCRAGGVASGPHWRALAGHAHRVVDGPHVVFGCSGAPQP